MEVQSSGGHVIGVGTIHGNVDISTHGDSVRTVLSPGTFLVLHSPIIRGQQQSVYRIYASTRHEDLLLCFM